MLDPNFTWTDSSGMTRTRSEILRDLHAGKKIPVEAGSRDKDGDLNSSGPKITIDGGIGLVQTHAGKLFTLRIWVENGAVWRLLVYHAVVTGAPSSTEPGKSGCENPCKMVPFEPRTGDEREVIHAYQAVERAVTAHDSAAWGSHIANEFFAVTSNSNQPLDKAARMAGLDRETVGGIAPFPLVRARMFEFGEAMVMTSEQKPERGLRLHVTRVWFKRDGAWLEAYSYQTTIQPGVSSKGAAGAKSKTDRD